MDTKKIVEVVARTVYEAATSQPGDGIPSDQRADADSSFGFQAAGNGGTILDGSYDLELIARAAIAAHTAALAEAGLTIVPREPTMPAMEEMFGRGPVDGIPLAEAKRRFRKAIEVLAAPAQR